jgi:hypothetical protein
VAISTRGIGAGQAVENCGLGKLEIGQAQDRFGFPLIGSAAWLRFHGVWPPWAPQHDLTKGNVRIADHPSVTLDFGYILLDYGKLFKLN